MENPKNTFQKFLEGLTAMVILGFLFYLVVCLISSVWWQILGIILMIIVVVIGYRFIRYIWLQKRWRDEDDYL